ncbi:MAG: tetratricopeptide repeat protein [Mucilaginibacter sp.]
MIPQIAFLVALFYLFSTQDETFGMIYAIVVYYFIVYFLRGVIAYDHRKGVALLKSREYDGAIRTFQKSVDFFTRNSWIDKYRPITLLSASKKCYREMGLCNIAFCYTQTQKGAEAKKLYEEILNEYPENDIAYSALNTLRSV